MVEKERQRALSAKVAIEFVKHRAYITYGTCGVVSKGLYEHSNSMRTISFVSHLLVFALVLAHSILYGTLDIVFRHVLTLGISYNGTQCRVILRFWTSSLDSNSYLLANFCKGTGHMTPSLKLSSFTIFKSSSHFIIFIIRLYPIYLS